jgi:hypothetical protein
MAVKQKQQQTKKEATDSKTHGLKNVPVVSFCLSFVVCCPNGKWKE